MIRVVKMGWNLRVNLAHHGFRPGWVEIFLQIQWGLIFDPAHLEPDLPGLNLW